MCSSELMLADDYDGALGVARDQVEGGAHALDVCVALTERGDEADDDDARSSRGSAMGVEMPLVIDSTDAGRDRGARSRPTPGRASINSINMENGRGASMPSCRTPSATGRRWSR